MECCQNHDDDGNHRALAGVAARRPTPLLAPRTRCWHGGGEVGIGFVVLVERGAKGTLGRGHRDDRLAGLAAKLLSCLVIGQLVQPKTLGTFNGNGHLETLGVSDGSGREEAYRTPLPRTMEGRFLTRFPGSLEPRLLRFWRDGEVCELEGDGRLLDTFVDRHPQLGVGGKFAIGAKAELDRAINI